MTNERFNLMKNTGQTRPRGRVAAATAVAALAATGLVIPSANALLPDNVHNAAGGGVNIHAEDTCVEKIGDTAHVKFMVQHQPLAISSDHGQTAAHGTLALPRDLENVSIKLKAVGGFVSITDKESGQAVNQYQDATVFDTPLDIPIREDSEDYKKEFPYGPPTLGGLQEKKSAEAGKFEYDGSSVPDYKESPDPDNPDLIRGSTLWTEQEVRDFVEKYDVHMKKTPQGFDKDASDPFGSHGSGDTAWYGEEYGKDYDKYTFGNVMTPVTFEVEGDIPIEQEDTFVTAAVSNLGWKSSMESYAGNYEMGSQSLQEYQWARPNQLPPAIPKSEDMIQLYKDKLSDAGLDISPTIAPTREMPESAKYKYIGSDTRPSARGDAGQWYTKTFTLHANRAVTYIGQVDTSAEDGADITAAHVTLCPSEETPTTTKQLTPETEIPEKETETEPAPTTTKQLIPETETPDTDTETETEPAPTTTKQLIPETETETPEKEPETETETPEKETETEPTTTKQLIPETETPEKETETPEKDKETKTPETETPEKEKETETPEKETETPEKETTEAGAPNVNGPSAGTPGANGANDGASSADTVEKNNAASGPQRLASTGANVLVMGAVAVILMAAGVFLISRKKA